MGCRWTILLGLPPWGLTMVFTVVSKGKADFKLVEPVQDISHHFIHICISTMLKHRDHAEGELTLLSYKLSFRLSKLPDGLHFMQVISLQKNSTSQQQKHHPLLVLLNIDHPPFPSVSVSETSLCIEPIVVVQCLGSRLKLKVVYVVFA